MSFFIGIIALFLGLINTIIFFTLALLVSALGLDANWVARAWADTAYWIIYRFILRVRVKIELHDPAGLTPGQSAVVISKHPSTPEIFGCIRSLFQVFPGLQVAPVGRDDHFLSWGWKAIGGIIITRSDREKSIKQIHRSIRSFERPAVVLIFPEGHRFLPRRWRNSSQRWRNLLDPKYRGVETIVRALPDAAYFRGTVCFNRQVHTVWQAGQLWRGALLVKLVRVRPPRIGQTKSWLEGQFDIIDSEVKEHRK